MCAAAADDDSLDGATAAKAALSAAAKDLKGVLHIPFLTIRLQIGAYAGSLVCNPLAQHLLDSRV